MNLILTPLERKPILMIENRKIEGGRWRLRIPEVLIGEEDRDRYLQGVEVSAIWHQTEGLLSYDYSFKEKDISMKYKVSASAKEKWIDLKFEVQNIGETQWPRYLSAAVCLSNKDSIDFVDPKGQRTIVFTEKGPETVWNLEEKLRSTPLSQFGWENRDLWPNHYYVETKMGSTDRQGRRSIKYGLVIRESIKNGWRVAFGWDKVARVDVNLNPLSCIHSHPKFEKLLPRKSMKVYGRIWFSQESPSELLQNYIKFMSEEKQ